VEPAAQIAKTARPAPLETKRGQVARQVEGVHTIEVKMILAAPQIDAFLKDYKLTVDDDEERNIYFFDTAQLDLLEAGIIARARRIKGDEHNSTVKFRPVDPDEVSKRWSRLEGFKLEADASEKGVDKSASLTLPVEKGRIKRAIAGTRGIGDLFDEKHIDFLNDLGGKAVRKAWGGRAIDFDRLTVFGPITANRWECVNLPCPRRVTAELWRRGDGDRLMELSMRFPRDHAAFAMAGFAAMLDEVGVERDREAKTKTRWALVN
jgi:hypothetical protein